jgi:hypothetical protein
MASRPGGGSIRTEPKTPSVKGRDHLSGGGGTLPVVTGSPRGLMVDLGDGKLPGWGGIQSAASPTSGGAATATSSAVRPSPNRRPGFGGRDRLFGYGHDDELRE